MVQDLSVVPRKLFLVNLPSGERELSCVVTFGTRSDALSWSCNPREVSRASEVSGSRQVTAAEQELGRSVLSVILPREWACGSLTIEVRAGEATQSASWDVGTYEQHSGFHLPLTGPVLVVGAHAIGEAHRSAWRVFSQQFGWDLLPLGSERWSVLRGSSEDLRAMSFAGFGAGVVSPGSGRIVRAHDGAADQDVVGSLPAPEAFADDVTRALGNYLVVDHGDSVFSLLGHLQRGSIKVHVGDEVVTGSPLGSVGASGNAAGPHLHFHFMDGPDPLTASPLPIELDLEGSRWSPRAGELVLGE